MRGGHAGRTQRQRRAVADLRYEGKRGHGSKLGTKSAEKRKNQRRVVLKRRQIEETACGIGIVGDQSVSYIVGSVSSSKRDTI